MKTGRPRTGKPTQADKRRLEGAMKGDNNHILSSEIDFNTVDMNSKNEMWTDKMTRSVLTTDGPPHNYRKTEVAHPIRISSKSSVRNSPTANRFR